MLEAGQDLAQGLQLFILLAQRAQHVTLGALHKQ
jgi:hypothetical protein